jgi:hypothetical protein
MPIVVPDGATEFLLLAPVMDFSLSTVSSGASCFCYFCSFNAVLIDAVRARICSAIRSMLGF